MRVLVKRAVISVLAAFASAVYGNEIVDGQAELIDETELRISGVLTPSVAEKFRKLVSDKVKVVSVSSEGGVTESAIEIAESIQKRGIVVRVLDFCLSSCANYIFVAGSRREVAPSAVVGWHGGHSFKPFRAAMDLGPRLVEKEKLLLREQILFAQAKTSLDLIIYSGLLTLGETSAGGVVREYTLWVPSAGELRRLGIENLDMNGDYRDAADIVAYLNSKGLRGQRVYTGKAYSYIPPFLLK